MSLADIVRKIEHDAAAEAAEIIGVAEEDASKVRADAVREAAALGEHELSQARSGAEEDARMRVAAARLAGRDRLLAEKRVMIERVIAESAEKLVAMPDEEYAALIAREIAKVTRGSETVVLGEADAKRLEAHLPAAMEKAGCSVEIGGTTSEIERGVLLEGDRMRVEVSIAALVAARQERCETLVAQTLFGEEA